MLRSTLHVFSRALSRKITARLCSTLSAWLFYSDLRTCTGERLSGYMYHLHVP